MSYSRLSAIYAVPFLPHIPKPPIDPSFGNHTCLPVSLSAETGTTPPHKYVVTDDLPSFLFCRRLRSLKPEIIFLPIPGLIPKRELLGFTQRLFIEYAFKDGTGVAKDSDNAQGVTGGLMDSLGVAEADENHKERLGLTIQVIREVQALSDALRLLTGHLAYRRPNPLIQLRTLSVGPFFGREEEELRATYWCLAQSLADNQRMERETQQSFAQVVATMPALEHYCQMPPSAPLSLGSHLYLPGVDNGRPSVAFHTDDCYDLSKRAAIGTNSRWYSHKEQWLGYQRHEYHQVITTEILNLLWHRDALAVKHGQSSPEISMDVYHSLPPWVNDYPAISPDSPPRCDDRALPDLEEEKAAWRVESDLLSQEITAGLARRVRKAFPEGIHPVDKVTWGQIFDAPPCDACGWRYEE